MSEVRSCIGCIHSGWVMEKRDRYPNGSVRKEWYCCKDVSENDKVHFKESGKYVKVTHGTECKYFEVWRKYPKTRSIRGIRKL